VVPCQRVCLTGYLTPTSRPRAGRAETLDPAEPAVFRLPHRTDRGARRHR
jgi:hypothetical protein